MKDNHEYPYQLALTHNEMIALIKYHGSQMRAVPKRLGKTSLELSQRGLEGIHQMKSLHAEAKRVLDYHSTRARGIMSLLDAAQKPNGEKP